MVPIQIRLIIYEEYISEFNENGLKNLKKKVERKYNNRRQIVQETYYGTDGKLIALEHGYAIIESDYDEKGVLKNIKYFDIYHEQIP